MTSAYKALSLERLREWADLMRSIQKSELDMDDWVSPEDGTCGTAACAAGHACRHPAFKFSGLWLSPSISTLCARTPAFNNKQGYFAITAFFGIKEEQAHYICQRSRYDKDPTPEDVARRIEQVIAQIEGDR